MTMCVIPGALDWGAEKSRQNYLLIEAKRRDGENGENGENGESTYRVGPTRTIMKKDFAHVYSSSISLLPFAVVTMVNGKKASSFSNFRVLLLLRTLKSSDFKF